MASRWCWVKVSWFVLACLSSATGECPDGNVVKVAVNGSIIFGGGDFASVQYPVDTSLKLSCVWPQSQSCRASSLPHTQRARMTLGGILKSSSPSCVTVVNEATCKKWYESSISYVVKSGHVNMLCSFDIDSCTTTNILVIYSGSTPQYTEDSSYRIVQSNADCPASPTGSTTSGTTKTSPTSSSDDSTTTSHSTTTATAGSTTSGTTKTSPTSSSDDSTTTSHSTTTATAGAATIPGLNPLIYTLLAVTLLGTASVVAMISCWMRHRRIMQRRREALFGTEYLDFMGEQDFTTVTTNQLLASLGEAPPTYQQSEVIEQRLRQAEDSDEEAPPPLPPRNTSTQDHHQLESEPSEQVTGAEEADVGERGEEDKEERPIEPSTTDSEEEETHSEKDGDSMALIG